MNVGLYSLGLVPDIRGKNFTATTRSGVVFRPHRLRFLIDQPELVIVTTLTLDGKEQLVGGGWDAYQSSFKLADQLNERFLVEYGLKGKSDEELDRWLDAHRMSMPGDSVGRLELPTLKEGQEVALGGLVGDVPSDFTFGISLTGFTRQ